MTAHAHLTSTRSRPPGTQETRLPWWAVVLPALAFCALLALIVTGGDGDTAQRGSEQLARFLERLQQTLT